MSGWDEEEGEDHGGLETEGRGWVSGTLAREQGNRYWMESVGM